MMHVQLSIYALIRHNSRCKWAKDLAHNNLELYLVAKVIRTSFQGCQRQLVLKFRFFLGLQKLKYTHTQFFFTCIKN